MPDARNYVMYSFCQKLCSGCCSIRCGDDTVRTAIESYRWDCYCWLLLKACLNIFVQIVTWSTAKPMTVRMDDDVDIIRVVK